eukprot:GHVQ01017758.1.p1 GENE.GHVQ01017758.1~~GHVQ01017758.1.p1  ORF type:complete len:329 (-),score=50.07 GHVQ01017758.1:1226-2212(-)
MADSNGSSSEACLSAFRASVKEAESKTGIAEHRSSVYPLPKLYIYEHCRFCIRPRMLLGLKKIKHDLVFVANDDFETPMRLCGKKMVPILEYRTPKTIAAAVAKFGQIDSHGGGLTNRGSLGWPGLGRDGTLVMTESMDIIKQLDQDESLGAGPPILNSYQLDTREDLLSWTNSSSDSQRRLLYPRLAISSCLPEFHSKRSREVFKIRHPIPEPSDYSTNLLMSPKLIVTMNELLSSLSQNILQVSNAVTGGGGGNNTTDNDADQLLLGTCGQTNKLSIWFSADDIDIWTRLRNLTIVKGLEWPERLWQYMSHYSDIADIPLLTQMEL